MNIHDLLQSFHQSSLKVDLPANVVSAIQSNNIDTVVGFLNSCPTLISNSSFLQCFAENFTPELRETLETQALDYMNLLPIAKKTVLPLPLWKALLHHKTCDPNSLFQWALDGWYTSATLEHQINASQVLPLCFETNPRHQKTFLQHVALLFPRLGVSDTEEHSVWSAQQWNLLQEFSTAQWLECFEKKVNFMYVCDAMLSKSYPNALANLYEIFQRLPSCATAFQQHYDTVSFTFNDLKQWAASGEGLQGSPMYKKLPKPYQIDFFYDLEQIYVGGNSNIGVEQQRLMGLTPVDLFLRRFVRFDNEDLADYLANTYSNFEMIFSNNSHLSVLHALMEKPKNLLQLDPKYGEDLAKCLDDGVCFEYLCDADVDTLDAILKRFPQIAQWTDSKGNTFAHWYVVQRIISEEMVKLFYNHDLLSKPNTLGFVVRDVVVKDVEDNMLDPHIISVFDRHILMSNINDRENTIAKRKM